MMRINPKSWNSQDPLPVKDDGSLALVLLKSECREGIHCVVGTELQYHGKPVVVSRWSSKLKTTVHAVRLEYSQVAAWIELEAP